MNDDFLSSGGVDGTLDVIAEIDDILDGTCDLHLRALAR